MLNPANSFPSAVADAARLYHQLGLVPVPIPRGGKGKGKAPRLTGWQKLRPTLPELEKLFPPKATLNIGLLLG